MAANGEFEDLVAEFCGEAEERGLGSVALHPMCMLVLFRERGIGTFGRTLESVCQSARCRGARFQVEERCRRAWL
jgi:hypothetical protein